MMIAKRRPQTELAADQYAVEGLGVLPRKPWSHLFLRDRDTGRPCWARPSTAWHYRYFATQNPSA
ncbi:hypothetical protein Kfla_4550 [Kribbella flavida DSM 17836]|uniref:Uncharacterized protein n=1 Tax=Kribbella flavida (strain DSM 17836 / JCM 10339 / NBRC 14399) TaxID=479435 RepID=D2PXW6_KRIFD|nr:hypothetical protein [Kribbella flavida]ADB33572.1 hypothetical protein Kfla_4550 [Kribbella flavida DSM 17836]